MDNDAKFTASPDPIGEDNADILAEKRRRAAASASAKKVPQAVSAAQLHAQMSKKPIAKPTVPPTSKPDMKPTVPPAVKTAGKPTVPSAAKPTGNSTAPSATKPAAKPTGNPTAPSAAKPTGNPTATPAAKPASKPTPPKAPAPSGTEKAPAGDVHSLIPHQKARYKTPEEAEDGKTRVTDVSSLRKQPVFSDDARQEDGGDEKPGKPVKRPKNERASEDESEGKNALISVIKAITYMVSVIVISVFLAVFIILVGNDVFAFVKDDTVVEVTIPEYATLEDIATVLTENGLIEYPSIFKIYSNLKMSEKEKENGFVFIAGTYPVSPMMNYDELLYAFKEKPVTGTSRITIPEGYTTDQIIDLLVSKGIGTREGYVNVINNYDFDYWFIDELEANGWKDGRYYRLDGYLFPDTYEFYNDSTEAVVINKLLRRFNQIFVDAFTVRATEMGYSVDEILTIASIVEKEGGTQSSFFNISSVFHNRLKNPSYYPCLESDATVVYAIRHETGEHINPTKSDLEYESPYNTHKYPGLTPGPIANPSASAIRAALYPAETNYYYFYSASPSVTLFASTLDEHLANVAKGASGAVDPQE
ncbi:MAG: endolytic transglycosylase MltG [Clostridia bacterium]|nr:endolytic transglycosylase MltG [Clostridia bacterium]